MLVYLYYNPILLKLNKYNPVVDTVIILAYKFHPRREVFMWLNK